MFYLQNPGRMARMFQPDMIWLPITAGVMQLIGFLIIRRIVDIEV
jgi:Flp pilus assembly protein TadB